VGRPAWFVRASVLLSFSPTSECGGEGRTSVAASVGHVDVDSPGDGPLRPPEVRVELAVALARRKVQEGVGKTDATDDLLAHEVAGVGAAVDDGIGSAEGNGLDVQVAVRVTGAGLGVSGQVNDVEVRVLRAAWGKRRGGGLNE
jgi:hypothetical protein